MRDDSQRLDDVLAAAAAITSHMQRGTLAIVAATIEHDLPPLVAATQRLRDVARRPE